MKHTQLDVTAIRRDFPILAEPMNGHRLAYLDSAATSLRPEPVISAMENYYRRYNANIHRGVYRLSEEATAEYEGAREKIRAFLNAPSSREIIFVRNATEAINLVAYSWGRKNIRPGDLIITTEMEHHSNFVPWQMLAAEKEARLEILPVDDDGRLLLDNWPALLASGPKLLAITHVSNVLGTINPIRELAAEAHRHGATVLVDGAQSVPHRPVDVQELGADFLAFSGHKMLGPTGVGVLWGREAILQEMQPFLYGGDMIREVTRQGSVWNDLPWKFEAGTSSIAEAIGLGAAVDYLTSIGLPAIAEHTAELVAAAWSQLRAIPGLTTYGPPPPERLGSIAFTLADIHPHDLASILDREGVALRAGHHCAQPLMERFGLAATARASFYLYNGYDDIESLVGALNEARRIFGV